MVNNHSEFLVLGHITITFVTSLTIYSDYGGHVLNYSFLSYKQYYHPKDAVVLLDLCFYKQHLHQ